MKAAVEKEQAASASVEHPWRWRKGESGNPAGRPNGSRNKATILGEMLLEQDVEAPVRLAVKTALEGDKALLRFCLSRLFAPARHQRVAFDLPKPIGNPARDAAAAYDALLRAVAAGEIAPEEARVVMEIVRRAPLPLGALVVAQQRGAARDGGETPSVFPSVFRPPTPGEPRPYGMPAVRRGGVRGTQPRVRVRVSGIAKSRRTTTCTRILPFTSTASGSRAAAARARR